MINPPGLPPNIKFIDTVIPSRTQIEINGMGKGRFIVSKVKISGTGSERVCRIDAYSITQLYQSTQRGTPGAGSVFTGLSPMAIIDNILVGGTSVMDGVILSYPPDNIHKYYDTANNNWGPSNNQITIPAGTSIWRILQICALRLGCKIWFEGDKAYVIDFRRIATGGYVPDEWGDMKLYDVEDNLSRSVIGTAEISDDGLDIVNNSQTVTYGSSGARTSFSNSQSITYYGMREGNALSIPEITNATRAQEVARGIVDYRTDMQRSVKFSVKEISDAGWSPWFENPVARASSISNEVDDLLIDNISPSSVPPNAIRPQYLFLSEFERRYPEGYSTYIWGKVANVDLPQAMSSLMLR